jgi:hypothetical protein
VNLLDFAALEKQCEVSLAPAALFAAGNACRLSEFPYVSARSTLKFKARFNLPQGTASMLAFY